MRFAAALGALCASFVTPAYSQQYAGEVINNTLPNVPGSEIAYFKIKDPAGSSANLTLINYISHGSNNQRLVPSKLARAVIVIHGQNRDPGTYMSEMLSALSQTKSDPNVNFDTVAIVAPYFPNGDDKNYGYPWVANQKPGRGSNSSALVWYGSQWSGGANNQYPYKSTGVSSFAALDQIVQYFDNTTLFPNMKQIVVAGHSLGAQTTQRYAAVGNPLNTKSPISYWIGNPNSYVWLSQDRPLSTLNCPTFDEYREGYTDYDTYGQNNMTYGVKLVDSGRTNILANFQSKSKAYARGIQDVGDDSSDCDPLPQGGDRNERFFNFIKAFPPSCSNPNSAKCDTVDFVNAGHDAGAMFAAPASQARLFLDNFYGNFSRAYDFGYPRQQLGDDPYPNPAQNSTPPSKNTKTYAGGMTYQGCYFDGTPPTLANMTYNSNANTIEMCTAACVSGGNTIAGLEIGSNCFCGKVLGYQAAQVIDSSCITPCSGNNSEICGNSNRLSLYANAPLTKNPTPQEPATIGNFSYQGCYTETPTGKALNAASTSGQSVTLEYCANYCSGYQYFGTEYADECYCGNVLPTGANLTNAGDCNMLCAGNVAEFCGAGNRLSLYMNPNYVPGTTPSSTSPGSTSPSSPSSTGLICPSANNATYVSNGKNFTIECGVDHQAGDLTSLSVSSLQACIDACAQNSQCVDATLSGSACYLKSSLGPYLANSGLMGARLSNVTTTGAPTTPAATTSTTSASIAPSATGNAISCPGSNGQTYITANNETFLIECGIDHQAGDFNQVYGASFQGCVETCATYAQCVDVAYSGSACYLKSSVGAAVNNGVWGARLIQPGSSSTTSSTSSTSSVASSTSTSSISPSATTLTSSSSSSTSSISSLSSSTSTTTTTSSPVALPSGFVAVGCFVDNVNGVRQLPTSNGSSSTNTPATCAANCRALGYKFSGTEYASECYCGNTLPSTNASSTDCNMACSGDATQTCGAGNRLSVVQDTTWTQQFFARASYMTWNLMACYVDSGTRTLPNSVSLASYGGSSNATIANCLNACQAAGYSYCGEEYYSECWASNTAPAASLVAAGADPLSAGCNFPCNGNKTEACGGANRVLVYVNNGTSQAASAKFRY